MKHHRSLGYTQSGTSKLFGQRDSDPAIFRQSGVKFMRVLARLIMTGPVFLCLVNYRLDNVETAETAHQENWNRFLRLLLGRSIARM